MFKITYFMLKKTLEVREEAFRFVITKYKLLIAIKRGEAEKPLIE